MNKSRKETTVPPAEALSRSAERYKELADSFPQVVAETDIKGNLTFVNANSFKVFGYTKEDFEKGLNVFQMLIPDDHTRAKEQMGRVLRGEKAEGTRYTAVRKDGATFPVTIYSSRALSGGEPSGIRSIVIDETERVHMEEALRDSEERYRSIFENAVEGIYQTLPDGRYIRVNPALARMHGFASPEEMMESVTDMGTQIFMNPGVLREYSKRVEKENTVVSFEFELYRKDRSRIWVSTSARAIRNDKGEVLYYEGMVEDITERKEAEERLRESESRFRAIADYAYDWENWVDPRGRLLWINRGVFRLTGYTVEECMAMSDFPLSLFDGRDRARMAELFEEAVRGSSGNDQEFRLRCKDGSVKWIAISWQPIYDIHGAPLGHRSGVRDITARKEAEQALRRSERRYRTLLENIRDGVCITGPDRKFTFVNDIVVRRSGYPREWFEGRTALDLVRPELREFVRGLGNKSVTGEKTHPFEVSYLNASGDEMWMECHITPLFEDEEFAGFLTVNRDITERKRVEEELRQHRDHLERLVAERTAALAESEKRYRELVDNAMVGVYQITTGGEILYHNDYLVQLLGFGSLEEIRASKAPLKRKDPADRETHLKILEERGKLISHETQFVTKGGETLDVLISAGLSGDIISGMVVDITDRKRAEEELRARTEQLNESNVALKVLLGQRDKDRQDMEERFISNVKHLVLPYLEDLSGMSLGSRQETLVSIAKANLDQIVSPFLKNMHYQYAGFTPAELRVAGFIKDGKTVKEIAKILGVSEAAINSHRQHIRNKLGLRDKKVNLRAHLQSLGAMPQSNP